MKFKNRKSIYLSLIFSLLFAYSCSKGDKKENGSDIKPTNGTEKNVLLPNEGSDSIVDTSKNNSDDRDSLRGSIVDTFDN